MYAVIELHDFIIDRQIILVFLNGKEYQLISCRFKLRCDDIFFFCHIHCKGHQCRRNINLVKGSGHGIFSSDGRKAESDLCTVCSQQCCKRLAPALRILVHSAEILLEGESYFLVISTGSHDTGKGLQYRINGTVVWAPGGQIGIKSIGHHGYGVAFSLLHRKLCHHALGLGQLILSTIGHENTSCADGTIKHLHQPLLGADVKV